jgi:uncharacterized protein (DUF952 family)
MLLVIDPSLVPVEIRLENTEGGDDLFPHIYGELPLAAVVRAESATPKEDGTFDLGDCFRVPVRRISGQSDMTNRDLNLQTR